MFTESNQLHHWVCLDSSKPCHFKGNRCSWASGLLKDAPSCAASIQSFGIHLTSHFLSSALLLWSNLTSLSLYLFLSRAAPSAEFSVDRTRHLMSFLTMLGPSPDWNVGLSAEDLCTKECGWAQRVVQDLIPWDAGTDSGVSYEVRNNTQRLG